MTTYHWLTSGGSASGSIVSGTEAGGTVTIPPGGQINRVILKNCVAQFQQSGTDLKIMQGVALEIDCNATFVEDVNGIYSGTFDLRMNALTILDPILGVLISTVSWHGGDRELGFDRRNLRYGEYAGIDEVFCGVEMKVYANNANDALDAVGEIDFAFDVLYSTRP